MTRATSNASALTTMAETEPDALKTIATMNLAQLRALTKLATAIGNSNINTRGSEVQLESAVTWLRDGKPLPKCDAVAPTCSVDETVYDATCAVGTYASIAPTCVYCPSGGIPQRNSNGVVKCLYKR